MYPSKIYDELKNSFERANIPFQEQQDKGAFYLPNGKINSTLKNTFMIVEVREKDYIVQGTYQDFTVSEEQKSNVAELLSKINNLYFFPQLIFNFSYNGIWCRIRTVHDGNSFDPSAVVFALKNVSNHLEKYGNAILGVALGFQSVDDTITKISNDINS